MPPRTRSRQSYPPTALASLHPAGCVAPQSAVREPSDGTAMVVPCRSGSRVAESRLGSRLYNTKNWGNPGTRYGGAVPTRYARHAVIQVIRNQEQTKGALGTRRIHCGQRLTALALSPVSHHCELLSVSSQNCW